MTSNPPFNLVLNHDETDFSSNVLSLLTCPTDAAITILGGLIQPNTSDVADITIRSNTTPLTGPMLLDQTGAAGTPILPIHGPIFLPKGTDLKLYSAAAAISFTGYLIIRYDY